MLKRKSKYITAIAILLFVILGIGFLYIRVNRGFITNYKYDGYSMGEEVALDDFILKVTGLEKNVDTEEEHSYPVYRVTVNFKNTSGEAVEVGKNFDQFSMANDRQYDCPMIEGLLGIKNSKVESGESIDISLLYQVMDEGDLKNFKLCIPRSLYEKDIKEYAGESLIYGKYIDIKSDN